MKKNIIIITFLALASISQLSAQMTDRLVPHFGYMFTQLTMEDIDSNTAYPLAMNNLTLGVYYTIKQAKDIVSVGLDPSFNFGLNFSPIGKVNLSTQIPLFVMGRLGANSTTYNTQKIGIGAGIGIISSYNSFISPWFLERVKEVDFHPAVVFEGTLNSRGSNVTGRIQFSLDRAKGTGTLFAPDGTFYTSVFSFGIIYGL